MSWEQASTDNSGQVNYRINNLSPASSYSIYADGKLLKKSKSDNKGSLIFDANSGGKKIEIVL